MKKTAPKQTAPKQTVVKQPSIATIIILFVLASLSLAVLVTVVQQKPSTSKKQSAEVSNVDDKIISKSPSKQYWVRLTDESQDFYGLEIVGPTRPEQVPGIKINPGQTLNTKNVVWSEDESVIYLTYISYSTTVKDQTARLAVITNSGNVVNDINVGRGSFYGVSKDQAFPPVLSSHDKYVAVQSDLIHSISVFTSKGVLVKVLPTKYSKVELFSEAMYQLEDGKYSPFFEYKWNETNTKVLYRMTGTEKFYEVSL